MDVTLPLLNPEPEGQGPRCWQFAEAKTSSQVPPLREKIHAWEKHRMYVLAGLCGFRNPLGPWKASLQRRRGGGWPLYLFRVPCRLEPVWVGNCCLIFILATDLPSQLWGSPSHFLCAEASQINCPFSWFSNLQKYFGCELCQITICEVCSG